MTLIRKGYRFRLKPNRRQLPGFVRMGGARRWVWNWALARRIQYYRDQHVTLPFATLSRELTRLKRQPETRWLQEVDSQALQQALRDLDQAFREFFAKRARFPHFKSKKRDRPTFRIPQRVRVTGGRVFIPKIGWVRLRQSRSVEGRMTSATFTQDALGHWDVSLALEVEIPDAPIAPLEPARIVGIDQGLSDFVVLSDGTRIAAPRYFRKGEYRLRRAHRHLSRCKRGSQRRGRARQRVARLHQRIANRRRDFVHQTTTYLIRTYHGVCVQELAVSALARTKLAKSVQDAALGELHRQLAYKSTWHRRHFVVVDRWFPSSKLCRRCGALNDALSRDEREWICPCGAFHDRDLDAAGNIRAEGLKLLHVAAGHAETGNARKEAVRLPWEQASMKRESPAVVVGSVNRPGPL